MCWISLPWWQEWQAWTGADALPALGHCTCTLAKQAISSWALAQAAPAAEAASSCEEGQAARWLVLNYRGLNSPSSEVRALWTILFLEPPRPFSHEGTGAPESTGEASEGRMWCSYQILAVCFLQQAKSWLEPCSTHTCYLSSLIKFSCYHRQLLILSSTIAHRSTRKQCCSSHSTWRNVSACFWVCRCASATCLSVEKHLWRGERDSNTLMQNPQNLLHLVVDDDVTELLVTNPSHSRSQVTSFKLSYMLR